MNHADPHQLFLAVLLLLLPVLFLLFLSRRRASLTSNLPPSPPKLPIIGNLHQVNSPFPHIPLHSLSQKYGPLMLLQMGQIPTLVVSSPELAMEVFKTQDHVFADRPSFKVSRVLMHGRKGVTFAPYGEYWRQVKKIYAVHLLNSTKVQSFRALREEEVGRMVERIRELASSDGGVVDLSEVFYQFANGFIIRAATGGRSDSATTARFHQFLDETSSLIAGFQIDDVFPSLGWIGLLTGMDDKLKKLCKKWDDFLTSVIDEHVGNEKGDFVDVLLSLQNDPELNFALTSEDVKILIMDMSAAGTDTSYVVLEWAMSELIRHPRILSNAKAEIASIADGKAAIADQDLPRLPYLKAVVAETLRLHPPAPLLIPHESVQETKIRGYTIPKGTRVLVNVWALARDPGSWASPEEFAPERFLEEGAGDYRGMDFRFLPFGSGRRGCPGREFAMAAVELAVANLVHLFDWGVEGGGEGELESLDMAEAPGLTVRRAKALRVMARPCE